MNTKALKIITTVLMAIFVICTISQVALAATSDPSSIIEEIDQKREEGTYETEGITKLAGRIIGLVRNASVVVAAVLIAIFGFKFIMGSANEKADYQKAFIPLIVGVAVVFAASTITKLILDTF